MFSSTSRTSVDSGTSQLFLFSGDSLEAVMELLQHFTTQAEQANSSMLSLVRLTQSSNPTISESHRLAIVARDKESLIKKLTAVFKEYKKNGTLPRSVRVGVYYSSTRLEGKVAFLYPGQGAQYPNMLLDLVDLFPTIQKWLDLLDATYKGASLTPPSETIRSDSTGSDEGYENAVVNLLRSDTSLGTLVGCSLALAEILEEIGLNADVVTGQSTGELTGLIYSGSLAAKNPKKFKSLFKGLQNKLIELELSGQVPRGSVLAVSGLPVETVEKVVQTLNSSVCLCLINCPNQMVLFGSKTDVKEAFEAFTNLGVFCQILPFQQVYHNEGFKKAAAAIGEVFEDIGISAPQLPLFSSIDGTLYPEDPAEVLKLATSQWSRKVNFPRAVRALYNADVRFFIDVGPGNSLSAYLKDILDDDASVVISSASGQRLSGLEALQQLAGTLFAAGKDINYQLLIESSTRTPKFQMRSKPDVITTSLKPAIENQFQNDWPFLGEILEHSSKHLRARRILTFTRDTFLLDHTLTRGVSNFRDDLVSLSVQPFTCSAEMVAEAAAYLLHRGHPGLVVQELKDLRGHRWVSLDTGKTEIEIEAVLISSSTMGSYEVKVDLFQKVTGTRVERLHLFEGTAILGSRYFAKPEPMPFKISTPLTSLFGDDLLYSDGAPPADPDIAERFPGFFLGPHFRPIKRIRRWDMTGAEFDLEVLDRSNFFANVSAPRFQTEPVLADAMGQMIGYAAREQLGRAYNFFPVLVESFQQFAELPEPGIKCIGRVSVHFRLGTSGEKIQPELVFIDYDGSIVERIPLAEARQTRPHMDKACLRMKPEEIFLCGEIEILDEDGSVLMRATGWADRPLCIPSRASLAMHYPLHEYLSAPVAESSKLICRYIDSNTFGAWEESGGVWKRNMVHMSCVESERRHWYSMTDDRDAQLDWLMRLVAVKDAARIWAMETMGVRLSAVDIELRPISDNLVSVKSCIQLKIDFPLISVAAEKSKVAAVAHSLEARSGVSIRALDKSASEDTATELVMSAAKQLLQDSAGPDLRVRNFSYKNGKVLLTDGDQYFTGYYYQSGDTEFAVCMNNTEAEITQC